MIKGGIEDEFENAPVQKTGPTYVEVRFIYLQGIWYCF